MVKRLFFVMLLSSGLSANAQQLSNGDFETPADWVDCYPWEKGNYGTTAYGKEPEGWCMSNVPNSFAGTVGERVTGYNSSYAAKIANTDALGNGIPGYMTLGTTWATAEAKLTGSTRNTDGGVFGGIEFTYRPDAIRMMYKRDSSYDVSTIVAYSWKGTWTQEDVPSNTAIGTLFSYGTATKVTMTDRDVNILGLSYSTGGTVTKTSDAELVASVIQTVTASPSDWTELVVPLEYKSETAIPEKFNLVIACAGYQDGGGSITSEESITVDDIELVYYHSLTDLSYDGTAISDFSETTLNYDLSTVAYDTSKSFSYTKKGVAATVSESYNEDTGEAYITVTGDNGESTTYTIQFKTYALGDVNLDGAVDVNDVTALVDIILGTWDTSKKHGNSDINGSGSTDVNDVTALVDIILGN